MKNKFNLLVLTTISAFTSGSILAEELSYDYIDTTIVRYDLKSTSTTFTYDGYSVSVSKKLFKNVHLLGSYLDLEKGNENTIGFKSIGFGMNYPINKSTDIVFDYLHFNWEQSHTSSNSVTTKGEGIINSIEPEIRHQFSDDIELNAGLVYRNIAGLDITYKGLSAGAIYRINNNFSLKFKIFSAKDSASNTVDWNGKEFGIRYHF